MCNEQENEMFRWYCSEALPIINESWGCPKVQASSLLSEIISRSDEAFVFFILASRNKEWAEKHFKKEEMDQHMAELQKEHDSHEKKRILYKDKSKLEHEESGGEEDVDEDEEGYYLWDKEEELNTSYNKLITYFHEKNRVRCDAEAGMFAYSLCMQIFDLLRKSPHSNAAEEAYKDVARDLLDDLKAKKMEKRASKKQKIATSIDYGTLFDV